jgi:hypothetical protein
MPALALYLAAIVSTFLLLNRVYRRARGRPEFQDIQTAAFCILLALTMYCTAITFVNFAYFFYLPTMSSLVIAVSCAAEREFSRRPSGSVAPQPGFAPQPSAPPPRKSVVGVAR